MRTTDRLMYIAAHTIPEAFCLLPRTMDSPAARAMLLAIGLQESKFQHRKQVGGPAKGFWQFEQGGGVKGVLTHKTTQPIISQVCDLFLYPTTPTACHTAIEHHDLLATCFARLLLWTDPRVLPSATQQEKGWSIYLAQWRPGKPHPDTWPAYFAQAWRIVQQP